MQLIAMRTNKEEQFKGDIVEVRASGTPFTPSANFVMIDIDGEPIKNWKHVSSQWRKDFVFEVLRHYSDSDKFRVKISGVANRKREGEIVRQDLESAILEWGGKIIGEQRNALVFDFLVFDVSASRAFWESPSLSFYFSEVGYDVESGVHTIRAEYKKENLNPTHVEMCVNRRGFDVISHSDKVMIYETTRTGIFDIVKQHIKTAGSKIVHKRRFRLPENIIDRIVENGGKMSVDKDTISAMLEDKMRD